VLQRIITMTTDFGDRDGFVGAMKGVIYAILPEARIVAISHGVPRQDVAAGAVVLRDACPYFPAGTIHLAVVDPGVGSARVPIVAVTDKGIYVLPDNGLISLVAAENPIRAAYRLENPAWRLPAVSQTFHGRDIFAPAAAHLARGAAPGEAGRPHDELVFLPRPRSQVRGADIVGEIVYCDTFGNLETNITNASLPSGCQAQLTAGAHTIAGPSQAYAAVPAGDPLFIRGSSGFVEIAVNGGSAAAVLRLDRQDQVILRVTEK